MVKSFRRRLKLEQKIQPTIVSPLPTIRKMDTNVYSLSVFLLHLTIYKKIY